MKKILISIVLILAAYSAGAQVYRDSLYVRAADIDSTYADVDIFARLRGTSTDARVIVAQSSDLRAAFDRYLAANRSSTATGYRIRVYYNSRQNSRSESEQVARAVVRTYPWLGVYRTFESPNFKVTVGDFRTRDEALKVFNELKALYPSAFIIKESINYPAFAPVSGK